MIDIGQGEKAPEIMWVLFDRDNGDSDSKRYLWWFRTRQAARAHRKQQERNSNNARLTGPVSYLIWR